MRAGKPSIRVMVEDGGSRAQGEWGGKRCSRRSALALFVLLGTRRSMHKGVTTPGGMGGKGGGRLPLCSIVIKTTAQLYYYYSAQLYYYYYSAQLYYYYSAQLYCNLM